MILWKVILFIYVDPLNYELIYHNKICLSSDIFVWNEDFGAVGGKSRPERGLAGEEILLFFPKQL
jgi:hypothetical protein